MRAIGLVSVGVMMITLPVADAAAASNRWCAVYNRRGGIRYRQRDHHHAH